MSDRVVVIGAGAAGLAAAFVASQTTSVTLIDGGPGATSFTSGALDWTAWDEPANLAPSAVDADARSFVDALDVWRTGDTLLATLGGRIRTAHGRDRGLLDLSSLGGARVLVPRAGRAQWDADSLCRSWTHDAGDIDFQAIDATVLRYDDERRIADGEIAARHDDERRVAWLAHQLRSAVRPSDRPLAFLVGPWLGASHSRAETLSELVGHPVGEALSGQGTAPGLRFEAARSRLVASRSIELLSDRAERIDRMDGGWSVVSREGRSIEARSIVLATGGLTGGGITYDPPDHGAGPEGAASMRAGFKLSLELPDPPQVGTERDSSSLFGPVLDEVAWPGGKRESALDRVGIFADGQALSSRLFVAGDLLAHRPRTLLEAISSGLRAGRLASSSLDGATAS